MNESEGFRDLVGVELSSAGDGRAVVSVRAADKHLNPSGTVHGGLVYTLVDVSMAEALNTTIAEGDERPVTIEIKVNYMEPGKPGTLVSTAQIRKGGKRITIVEAEVSQEDSDEVVALATGTYTLVGG
ncbi:MAG TPA: PaaI family thioesterase [Rubrobacteraceae bacterium]|jgi:acyl-CoA thioesterase|nr:PaaI family thioesterase [Rubrobacteraceae bacterium]